MSCGAFIEQTLFNSFPPNVQKSAAAVVKLLSTKFGDRGDGAQRELRDRTEKLTPHRFPDLVLWPTAAQRFWNAANATGVNMSKQSFHWPHG